jgi:hypothetical protein
MPDNEFELLEQRHAQAWEAHRKMYTTMHPPPAQGVPDKGDKWTRLSLTLMTAASTLVSGSRTVTEFGGGIIGLAAFVMLELSIIGFAYQRTKNNYTKTEHAYINRLSRLGVLLALAVTLIANLDAQLDETSTSELIDTIIDIALAVSAPLLAYISGHLFGQEVVYARMAQKRVEEQHHRDMAVWGKGMLDEWEVVKPKLLSRRPVPQLSASARPQASEPDTAADSQADAGGDPRQRVRQFLSAHPEAMDWSVRRLESVIGVSKSTIAEVKKELKGDG